MKVFHLYIPKNRYIKNENNICHHLAYWGSWIMKSVLVMSFSQIDNLFFGLSYLRN